MKAGNVVRVACCSCKVGEKGAMSCMNDKAVSYYETALSFIQDYAVEVDGCRIARAKSAQMHAMSKR